VSGSYLNQPLLGMTLNKNVLKNIGGEITDGILLNGDAQKIKVITGGEITCPQSDMRHYKMLPIYVIITTIKWCKSSQTVGQYLKFLFLRKPFMLGKNGVKVFDHIFPHKLTLKFLGDHSLTPCINCRRNKYWYAIEKFRQFRTHVLFRTRNLGHD
jgi:hypothetical protein